jgi:hypothetical protein
MTCGCGVPQHQVQAAVSLGGEHRNADIPARIALDGPIEHRQATRHVKSLDCNRNAGGTEQACDIEAQTYGFDWTPMSASKPKLPWLRNRVSNSGVLTRACVSSICCDVDRNVRSENVAGGAMCVLRRRRQRSMNSRESLHATSASRSHRHDRARLRRFSVFSGRSRSLCHARRFLEVEKTPRLKTRRGAMNHMPAPVRRNYGPPSQRSEGTQILGRGLARFSISNNLVGDPLSLVESLQPRAFHRANVHEDVLAAVIRLDESKALLAIEPLYSSLRHVSFFSTCASGPRFRAASSFEIWRKVVSPTQLCGEAKSFGRSSIDAVWSIGAWDARLASEWLVG